MDDKDHVFARFKDNQPASAGRREVMNIPRRSGASGSRSVEVVHARLGAAATAKDSTRRSGKQAHPMPSDGSFAARPATRAPAALEPDLAKAPPPVAHVMAAWEPSVVADEVATSGRAEAPSAETVTTLAESHHRRRKSTRHFADPFDAADLGANCLRCGYAIDPAREQRGLRTCADCR